MYSVVFASVTNDAQQPPHPLASTSNSLSITVSPWWCASGGWQKPSLNRSLRDAICLQSTGRGEPAFTSKVISNGKATAAERDLPKLPYVMFATPNKYNNRTVWVNLISV